MEDEESNRKPLVKESLLRQHFPVDRPHVEKFARKLKCLGQVRHPILQQERQTHEHLY